MNPRPQKGDIWEIYGGAGGGRPVLIVDIIFSKEYNSDVAVMKHLAGTHHVFEVPVVSVRQGVGIWVKVA
jgi:selenophosphate synthetase-related protein